MAAEIIELRKARIAEESKDAPAPKIISIEASPDQIPKKCESPLVIPCKFSAVTYSELHSDTHSVAARVLPISLGNKDLRSPGVEWLGVPKRREAVC